MQIRPALSIASQVGLSRPADNKTLRFTVKGMGAQAAVITGIEGKHADGRNVEIEVATQGQPTLPNGEVFTWDIHGVVKDERLSMTIYYEDIDGNKMKPFRFELVGSWYDK
jgi:hypothetical protein